MRLTTCLSLAALSLAVGGAATRPHYGGTLRAEVRAAAATLDPAAPEMAVWRALIYETLVRLDAADAPQPELALSWQHDAAFRRWQFTLRPGVKFHDGSALTAASAAAAVQVALSGATVTASGDGVIVRASHAMPDLPLELAYHGAIFARSADGGWMGTGPFRAAAFEPGRRVSLAANEDYWNGRPFVDAVEVQFGRGLRDQLADLELGKADVVEASPADGRRTTAQGRVFWTSADAILIAISFAAGKPAGSGGAAVREALAVSIDRAAMHTVLLQKQGTIAGALLPEWLSGYAYLFSTAADVARARSIVAGLPASARSITLSYEATTRAARLLADRIAVNARDAGLTVQLAAQNSQADARLVEIPIGSLDPERALADIAAALDLPAQGAAGPAASLYEAERKLLDDFRTIPLFHVPFCYAASSRVRVFTGPAVNRLGGWDFGGVWIAPGTP